MTKGAISFQVSPQHTSGPDNEHVMAWQVSAVVTGRGSAGAYSSVLGSPNADRIDPPNPPPRPLTRNHMQAPSSK